MPRTALWCVPLLLALTTGVAAPAGPGGGVAPPPVRGRLALLRRRRGVDQVQPAGADRSLERGQARRSPGAGRRSTTRSRAPTDRCAPPTCSRRRRSRSTACSTSAPASAPRPRSTAPPARPVGVEPVRPVDGSRPRLDGVLDQPRAGQLARTERRGPVVPGLARQVWSRSTPASGKPDTAFGSAGSVDLQSLGEGREPYASYFWTSPPLLCGDVVVVGNSTTDPYNYKTSPPGTIRGYDVRTGKMLWLFDIIPRPGQFGHDTWLEGSAEYTGHGNVWTWMSCDPELGYVYAPTSTPTDDWYGGHRPGDGLVRREPGRARRAGPASASGTSRRCTTGSGTTTSRRRRSWST